VDEEELAGGVANAGRVVRVGPHVLRPANERSASIHSFLSSLRAVGFEGASPFPGWAQSDVALASTAALVARFHEASRSFDPRRLSLIPAATRPSPKPTDRTAGPEITRSLRSVARDG
jgi:hypothetical protein